jgi:diguanylate cyclase (GGDEF)-like protein
MDPLMQPSRPPWVLIANDQEWAARALQTLLEPSGYVVLRAYTGRQALNLARTNPRPDVIILDARLPDYDGVDVCQALRRDPTFNPYTPILLTTAGTVDRAQTLAAYEAGAWEFFSEPLDGEVLLQKLANYLRAKRAADRVQEESLIDQITGLYNMRGLSRRVREIGAEAQRQHTALACVAFSTDDAIGEEDRPTPDEAAHVATHVNSVFRRTGRMSDVMGRLGLTDFAIIAPFTESRGAVRLVERLQQNFEAAPISLNGSERTLRIRAGYFAVPDYAEAAVDAVEILLRATAALRASLQQVRAGGNAAGPLTITAFDEISAVKLVQ